MGGRVAAARVVVADRAGALALVPQQRVDERGLADARRAEDDGRPARREVVVRERRDAVAGQGRDGPDLDARRDGLGRDPEPDRVVRDVGLVEHDDRGRAAGPGHREVALEAAQVEVAVEAGDDQRDVDVGREDLLVGRAAAGPATRVGRAPPEGGPTRHDGLDDHGPGVVRMDVVGLAVDRGAAAVTDRDPVADRGQVRGPQGLVAQPSGDHGVPVTGRGGHDPGVAVGGHDPGGPPSGRVERQEGGGPARVPAEVDAGWGR